MITKTHSRCQRQGASAYTHTKRIALTNYFIQTYSINKLFVIYLTQGPAENHYCESGTLTKYCLNNNNNNLLFL